MNRIFLLLLFVGLATGVAFLLLNAPGDVKTPHAVDAVLRDRKDATTDEGDAEPRPMPADVSPLPPPAPVDEVPPHPVPTQPRSPERTMLPPERPGRAVVPRDARLPFVAWKDTPAIEALEYVAEATGHRLQMSEATRSQVRRTRVSLRLEDTTAAAVLDLLTNSYGLWWTVRDGVLYVQPGDE